MQVLSRRRGGGGNTYTSRPSPGRGPSPGRPLQARLTARSDSESCGPGRRRVASARDLAGHGSPRASPRPGLPAREPAAARRAGGGPAPSGLARGALQVAGFGLGRAEYSESPSALRVAGRGAGVAGRGGTEPAADTETTESQAGPGGAGARHPSSPGEPLASLTRRSSSRFRERRFGSSSLASVLIARSRPTHLPQGRPGQPGRRISTDSAKGLPEATLREMSGA
jgi:hypothetical protein